MLCFARLSLRPLSESAALIYDVFPAAVLQCNEVLRLPGLSASLLTIFAVLLIDEAQVNGQNNKTEAINNMALQGQSTEQFRATRTWNTIVTAVQADLPVGPHRKGFRMFRNSFAGKEAVTWTLDYLQRNRDVLFDPTNNNEITREKVTLLLQKFIEQKIIEDVSGRGHSFKDSTHHFYTFNKDQTMPLVMYRHANVQDKSRIPRKTRSSSLSHITPPTIKCATSMVKLALVGLSAQRERRGSLRHSWCHSEETAKLE